jgi:hypothetical protein
MFPDWPRPGHGLELKEKDAEKFLAWQQFASRYKPKEQSGLAFSPRKGQPVTSSEKPQ